MITTEIFLYTENENNILFHDPDFRIVDISSDDWIEESDIPLLKEATLSVPTNILTENEWYQFTFKRMYEKDQEGKIDYVWFELIDTFLMEEK